MSGSLLAITPVDAPGGAETTLLRLLAGLRDRGWQIALTTPGRGPLREHALAAGFRWHALPLGGLAPRTGFRALRSWPAARRLSRDFEVVYLNGGVCGRVLPALSRRPVIGVRGRFAASMGPGDPVQTAAGAAGPRRVVLHIHDMVRRVPRFWRRADVVLAASRAVAERLVGLDAHVVYPPADPDPPAAAAPWPAGNGPVVGFIGRFEPRKGPLDFVRAAPAIRGALPRTRIVMVGGEPYGVAPEYTREVLRSAAVAGVEHYPWSDNAPGLMRHLDVLVLPSYEEPAGTVLAEAMAVGTPVVATRVDGLPEVVRDGVTGRLVEPGDVGGLAAAVLEVLEHRTSMGAAAREHARRFETDHYVEQVEELIAG